MACFYISCTGPCCYGLEVRTHGRLPASHAVLELLTLLMCDVGCFAAAAPGGTAAAVAGRYWWERLCCVQ